HQLQTFSSKQELHPTTLDLNEILGSMANLLRHQAGERISLQLNYCSTPPLARADRSALEQMILNLAANARDAMPEGGDLVISTDAAEIDEDYVNKNSEARAGNFA